MEDEERHSLECEYDPGKVHHFTSMWDKHCWGDAASRRGMSLEEYVRDELEQNTKTKEVSDE
jgi:hypothetical protein